jgi:hypothetical protein
MSLEALLLLALFILLPLIERLLRAARQSNERTPDRVPAEPRPASRPPPAAPQPRARMDPRMPRTADAPPASARPAVPRPPGLQLRAPAARRPAPGSRVVEDLHAPLTLRRAVVLMTILGPCRGVAPHEWKGAPGSAARG